MTIKECYNSTKEIIKIHRRIMKLYKVRELLLKEVGLSLKDGTYKNMDLNLVDIQNEVQKYSFKLEEEYIKIKQKYNMGGVN